LKSDETLKTLGNAPPKRALRLSNDAVCAETFIGKAVIRSSGAKLVRNKVLADATAPSLQSAQRRDRGGTP